MLHILCDKAFIFLPNLLHIKDLILRCYSFKRLSRKGQLILEVMISKKPCQALTSLMLICRALLSQTPFSLFRCDQVSLFDYLISLYLICSLFLTAQSFQFIHKVSVLIFAKSLRNSNPSKFFSERVFFSDKLFSFLIIALEHLVKPCQSLILSLNLSHELLIFIFLFVIVFCQYT